MVGTLMDASDTYPMPDEPIASPNAPVNEGLSSPALVGITVGQEVS